MNGLGLGASTAAVIGFCSLEHFLGRRRGVTVYTREWTLSNAGCAVLRAGVALVLLPAFAAGYAGLGLLAPARLSAASPATWILAWLEMSFLQYAIHRLEHRPGLLWALHGVHHQPEELNASAAQRGHALAALVEWPPLLLLALSGIPVAVFAAVAAATNAYELLLHSRLIAGIGPLECVLLTPDEHAVHHGTQPEYLDRNFGTSLRLWDRLFRTFAALDAPPLFGLAGEPRGRGALRANVEPLAAWLQESAAQAGR